MDTNKNKDINRTNEETRTHDSGEQLINKTATPQSQPGIKDISDMDRHEGSMHNGRLGGNFDEERENGNERNDRNK